MTEEILVFLRRHDRIEEILPYIEIIAQPGMGVVFLIPYPVQLWPWFCAHWVATQSRRTAIVAGKQIIHEYSWEVQKTLAEQKISLARDVLHKQQVEVTVKYLHVEHAKGNQGARCWQRRPVCPFAGRKSLSTDRSYTQNAFTFRRI